MTHFGYEDLRDISEYGSPSAKSHTRGNGGDIRNSLDPKTKASARRRYKRIDRSQAKNACKNYSKEY